MRVLPTLGLLLCLQTVAQTQPAAELAVDPTLAAAETYIGRALILRNFASENDLTYDVDGHTKSPVKSTDWTLAGVAIEKITRPSASTLQLEGTRTAIRYQIGSHTFERKPIADQHIRIDLPATTPEVTLSTLVAIFSTGIDPALQRSMPPYWQHYFNPRLPWPDALDPKTILQAAPTPGLTLPILDHRVTADYTPEARSEKLRGSVQLRVVIDPNGTPIHIAIRLPLGLGLDERAVEAVRQDRFQPGTLNGQPVPVELSLTKDFDPSAPQ